MDEDSEGMQFDSDVDEDESRGSFPRARIIHVEQCTTGEPKGKGPAEPLKQLVLNAVLEALRIVKENGSSCQTFKDILNYGETLLLASRDGENIDR